jgi:EmrB/QacA subfamily drug resistance transporter
MDATAPAPETKSLTHRETMFIVLGVLVPVFMGSLDNTILASALPTIGREFHDSQNLPWLMAGYLIANTAVTTLYGKISDIHGRRTTLLIAISLYMAGSLVCALAPNMLVLICGRVLHGLGGGGLTSTGMVVLGDLAAPRDRGKYYGYFSAVYTTAGAVGPALGGTLAEYFHWSLIFWINIPMGVLAIVLTLTRLKKLPRHERPHRLDFIGAFLISASSIALMLALSMGGVRYSWTAPPILALIALALAVGGLFVLRLMTAPEPLIPLSVLRDPVARCAIGANAFGWGAIVGLHIFLPMYLQDILGMSAGVAGLSVMVLSVALNTSAGISGVTMTNRPHYKTLPTVAMAVSIAALLVMGWQAHDMPLWRFEILLLLIGFGFGAMPPIASTALQNSVPVHQFGSAIGTLQFSRNLLCTIAIAVFGAMVLVGASLDPAGGVTHYSTAGFSLVFFTAAGCIAVGLLFFLRMEEKPLAATHRQ